MLGAPMYVNRAAANAKQGHRWTSWNGIERNIRVPTADQANVVETWEVPRRSKKGNEHIS